MSDQTLKPFSNLIYKISSNHLLTAIRRGLICMMPLFLIGALAILLANLPIAVYQDFMNSLWGNNWKNFLNAIQQGTNQIASLGSMLAISYFYFTDKISGRSGEFSVIIVLLITLSAFFIITQVEEGFILFYHFGQTELIMSILIGVTAPALFIFFHNHKLFKSQLFSNDTDIQFGKALASLEPALWTLACFALLKALLVWGGINDLNSFLYESLSAIILPHKADLFSAVYYVFFLHFCWFFGIHGSAVLDRLRHELWSPLLLENMEAVQAGLKPENILNGAFFNTFVFVGGSGATLFLIIAILIKAKKTNSSKLAGFSLPMGLFNINESMIYGVPIVLNPVYIIPFILVPVAMVLISYCAMALDLVPVASVTVHWTAPIFVSGYQATGSIRGSLLQLVNLIAGVAIYAPFVTISERLKEKEHYRTLNRLNLYVTHSETAPVSYLLSRQDEIGYLARTLAHDLTEDLGKKTNLFLMFQPQIDEENHIYGCEALLRWNHAKYGFIPPPTVIAIAEEAGIHNKLNEWIFATSLEAQNHFQQQGNKNLMLSINISPLQLNNPTIPHILREAIHKFKLDPRYIQIELTEHAALNDSNETHLALERFQELGVRLAIDDFGMGHTSIQYIRSFNFNTVKLDGSLVSDILTNENSKDIVRALVNLASGLDMHVIAEFVESEEQKDELSKLGCRIYQGYFYSKPLNKDTFEDYMEQAKAD